MKLANAVKKLETIKEFKQKTNVYEYPEFVYRNQSLQIMPTTVTGMEPEVYAFVITTIDTGTSVFVNTLKSAIEFMRNKPLTSIPYIR